VSRCEQTYINSNIAQLWPAHRMVQIVFAKVVLRQIRNVRKLHMRNVRRSKHTDIHFDRLCGVLCSFCLKISRLARIPIVVLAMENARM
jgi:hypothetical protein